MSVSDDSKMKLILIKHQIVFALYKQIQDKEFEKLVFLSELKYKNPITYELIKKYEPNELKCKPNVAKVRKQMIGLIKSECISILQMISGQDIEQTDNEINEKLKLSVNKLRSELNEVQKLSTKFLNNLNQYQNLFSKYLDFAIKYFKNYKIGFKLIYDEMVCSKLMSKTQTLCIKNRLDETDRVLQKYGKQEIIDKLREERKSLETEEMHLKSELKKAQSLLSQYESLDQQLLKEYKRLKSDLDCRLWAANELNQSSGSTSNASLCASD